MHLPGPGDQCCLCPLLGRDIAVGYCLDVNYQRLGFFKPGILLEVQGETGRTVEEIAVVCESCPNFPL